MKKFNKKSNKFTPKRYNTKISTIKEKYHISIDSSQNIKLGDFLKSEGYGSLADMLKV